MNTPDIEKEHRLGLHRSVPNEQRKLIDNYRKLLTEDGRDFNVHFSFAGSGIDLAHHEETYIGFLIAVGAVFNIEGNFWHTTDGVILGETTSKDAAGKRAGHLTLSAVGVPDRVLAASNV